MYRHQALVLEFHKKFGLTANEQPTIPSDVDAALRVNLIAEEMGELFEAVVNLDLIGTADACADLLYVIYGAGNTYGITLGIDDEGVAKMKFAISKELHWLSMNEHPRLMRRGTDAIRFFAEAAIKRDLGLVEASLNNLINLVHAVIGGCGISIDPVFDEVQRSNMSKVWDDGTVRRRETDGKILKPPTYSPADIKGILDKQRINP